MLINFTSKNTRQVQMFEQHALGLLKRMGHSGTVPGAMSGSEVAEYLARLQASFAQDTSAAATDDDKDFIDEPVGMSQRAFPLIELMKYAAENNNDIMWEKN